MSALIGVSPLLLLVAAGLSIMVIDAFARDRSELALVTAASLFVAATVAGVLMLGEDVTTAPELVTRYLAVDHHDAEPSGDQQEERRHSNQGAHR